MQDFDRIRLFLKVTMEKLFSIKHASIRRKKMLIFKDSLQIK